MVKELTRDTDHWYMLELPLRSRTAGAPRGGPRLSEGVERELVKRLFEVQHVTLIGAVGMLLQGVLCYTGKGTRWLIPWSVVSFAVQMACVIQEHAFRHRRDPQASTMPWERWYVVAACVNGGVFGIGGAAALGGIDDGFIRLVLYGAWIAYVMGAALRNAYSPVAARCYIGLALIPIVAVTLWAHDIQHFIELLLVLMLGGTALSVADTSYAQTVKLLQVDEERVELVRAEARSNQELGSANEQLAAANEQLAAVARIDALTGIPNRRAFDEGLETIVAAARRDRFPVSLLMFDIDWFKKYNDWYGHQAGDQCLRRVAQTLQGCLRRPTDLIARYGGEEFVALLPDTQGEGAAAVAELMRRTVEELKLESEASPAGVVTVSIGAATASLETLLTGEELLRIADMALYAAKRDGRNRVGGIHLTVPVG
jgi:diguanylate cyclase (GGDEF)-like protein